MTGVIQGLILKFKLYLLTHLNGACLSRIEFMLSKNELMGNSHLLGQAGKRQTSLYQNS